MSRVERVREALRQVERARPGPVEETQIRVGLLGRGIGASLTPIMHEREGRRLGLDYRYDLIDFDALDLDDADLGLVLDAVGAVGFRGVNVTFPFKQAIVPLLDDLSASAEAVGAVNTLVFRGQRRHGHNTDCFGFAESMRRGLGVVDMHSVVQVGAGGAGGAVAHALAELGVEHLAIVDVDEGRAGQLAARISSATTAAVTGHGPEALGGLLPNAAGLVNATPVGMEKLPGMPVDATLLSANHWVADIIYFPRETELLRQAKARGCKVLPGGGMAVFQAVRAFELFSGLRPDSAEMARTFAAYA